MMIDLGVLEPGGEGSHLRRRRGVFHRPSRLGAGLFILALGLLLAGEGPASADLRMLSSVPFAASAQYVVDGDSAFVAEAGPGGNRVSRYELSTGHRRWSSAVTALSTLVSLQPSDGVLVVTMYAPGLDGDHTVALDEATGGILWRDQYSLDAALPGGRVLLARAYAVDTGPVARQGVTLSGQLATIVRAVDLRTGVTAWSYDMAAGCQHAATGEPGEGTRMAVLCPGGDLRVLDLSTGRTLRTTRVPPVSGRAGSGSAGSDSGSGVADAGLGDGAADGDAPGISPILSTVGDRLLVGSSGSGTMRLVAYDAGTLRTLWTFEGTSVTYGSYPCAPLLCVSDDSGLTVLDPATGRRRWYTPQHVAVEVPGAESGASTRVPAQLAGALMVQPLGDSTGGLVAAATGRPLLDLDHWQTVSGTTPLPVFARWPEVPDGRVWFGILAGRPLGLRVIGFAPDVLKGQCHAFDAYLVCETFGERLRVWTYRL
jgi:outer membrane protein assembly factor BamB